MKEIHLDELGDRIESRRKEVNEKLFRERPPVRRVRTRARGEDEQRALTELCRIKWERAVKEGKIKKLGHRYLYYDAWD